MWGYTTRDVARLLDLSEHRIRELVRAGLVRPGRGPRGALRFSFQDLVVLQTARELTAARIPAATVRRSLRRLQDQLPSGRPLAGVRIAAQGGEVVVRDGETVWNPESGQVLFDFEVSELAKRVAPLARHAVREARRAAGRLDASQWYALGCELEHVDGGQARDAYRRALEIDPHLLDARINLGRLLHEEGELATAAEQYRRVLVEDPAQATAWFNLGVALEDLGREAEARDAYEQAIAADPGAADAYFNLSQLCERLGQRAAALRYLKAYRDLVTTPA